MADSREYVKLWLSYDDYFREYDDASVGALVRAMIAYRRDRTEPKFSGPERFIWPAMKRDMDESIKAQEEMSARCSENGKKGGRPKAEGKATPFPEKPEKPPLFLKSQKSQPFSEKPNGFSEKEEGAPLVPPSPSPPTPPVFSPPYNPPNPEEKERPPASPPAGGGAFDRFWSAYPRKIGKLSAKRAFDKVKVPVETLVSAIERQKCSDQWLKENGRFIPHPATWLNQGRWEDEVTPAAGQGRASGNVFLDMLEEERSR